MTKLKGYSVYRAEIFRLKAEARAKDATIQRLATKIEALELDLRTERVMAMVVVRGESVLHNGGVA